MRDVSGRMSTVSQRLRRVPVVASQKQVKVTRTGQPRSRPGSGTDEGGWNTDSMPHTVQAGRRISEHGRRDLRVDEARVDWKVEPVKPDNHAQGRGTRPRRRGD